MSSSLKTSRVSLGFVAVVREVFSFLKEFGFEEVDAEESIVRYRSEGVFLDVYHGRSSRELGLEVGLIKGAERGQGHSLSALIRAKDRSAAASFRNRIAVSAPELREGLSDLAAQLKRYGEEALEGESSFFKLLDAQRIEWANDYAADVRYKQVLPRADEAFRRRDYRAAAELFESIEDRLSPAEARKLEYARKHR